MALDINKLREFLDSEEGKRSTEEWIRKEEVKEMVLKERLLKVESYLKTHPIESIIDRIVREHDDTYRDRCYRKGYEPYPNHKFELLFDYIRQNYAEIDNQLMPQDFLFGSWFFKGYFFTIYCGQGCFYRIYDHKMNIIIQI
jgi:hypothetical protein